MSEPKKSNNNDDDDHAYYVASGQLWSREDTEEALNNNKIHLSSLAYLSTRPVIDSDTKSDYKNWGCFDPRKFVNIQNQGQVSNYESA